MTTPASRSGAPAQLLLFRSSGAAARPRPVRRPPRSGSDPVDLARRAFGAHVFGLPPPDEEQLEMAGRFALASRSSNPSGTAAAMLVVLDLIGSEERFADGGWIGLVPVHFYMHYEGRCGGPVRPLAMVERWLGWLHRQGRIDDRRLEQFLILVDDARASVGRARRRPLAERFITMEEWTRLAKQYPGRGSGLGANKGLVEKALAVLGDLVSNGAPRFRLTAIDPDEVAAALLVIDGDEPHNHDADGFLLGVGADFYAWLVEHGTVPRKEGTRIAARLSHLSLCTGTQVATG